jgi:hypothetical protein
MLRVSSWRIGAGALNVSFKDLQRMRVNVIGVKYALFVADIVAVLPELAESRDPECQRLRSVQGTFCVEHECVPSPLAKRLALTSLLLRAYGMGAEKKILSHL